MRLKLVVALAVLFFLRLLFEVIDNRPLQSYTSYSTPTYTSTSYSTPTYTSTSYSTPTYATYDSTYTPAYNSTYTPASPAYYESTYEYAKITDIEKPLADKIVKAMPTLSDTELNLVANGVNPCERLIPVGGSDCFGLSQEQLTVFANLALAAHQEDRTSMSVNAASNSASAALYTFWATLGLLVIATLRSLWGGGERKSRLGGLPRFGRQ